MTTAHARLTRAALARILSDRENGLGFLAYHQWDGYQFDVLSIKLPDFGSVTSRNAYLFCYAKLRLRTALEDRGYDVSSGFLDDALALVPHTDEWIEYYSREASEEMLSLHELREDAAEGTANADVRE